MLFSLLLACSKDPNYRRLKCIGMSNALSYGNYLLIYNVKNSRSNIRRQNRVYLLEDGAGSWPYDMACRTSNKDDDVQYFIYSADNVG